MSLLCFDSVDGAGKSTQVNLLMQKLANHPKLFPIRSVHFPDYSTKSGQLISDLLFNGIKDRFGLPLLFEINRREKLPLLLEAKANECTLICDRYFPSAISYAEPNISRDELQILFKLTELYPAPDLMFILDIDPKIALKRITSKNKDSFEKKLSYQQQVRESFLRLAKHYSDWIVLNADQDPEILSSEIFERVKRLFSNTG